LGIYEEVWVIELRVLEESKDLVVRNLLSLFSLFGVSKQAGKSGVRTSSRMEKEEYRITRDVQTTNKSEKNKKSSKKGE
jgi:hypothetical protein